MAEAAKEAGFKDIWRRSLITLTDMKKLMGKDRFKEMNRRLVEENSRSAMDQDLFMKKYNAYVDKYERESAEIEKLQKLREEQVRKAEQISAFMFEIHERDGLLEEFDEKLWLATVDKVLIHHDGRMVFKFRNGTEVTRWYSMRREYKESKTGIRSGRG